MDDQLTLQVKNTIAAIPAANEAASRWLTQRNTPPAADYFANLAIEELVTNCIKYAFDDDKEHIVQIDLNLSGHELMLTVTDDGHPFNPLEFPEPDINQPVEDRPLGGLGIHLLRKMADRIEYARVENKNQLTLCKSLGDQTVPGTKLNP